MIINLSQRLENSRMTRVVIGKNSSLDISTIFENSTI
jgi:hypothetical protein